jgi:CRISPR/Cas system-associated exonuclease Cas4 (RecB family)
MAASLLSKHFSYTRLSTFRKCPRKYWFKYVVETREAFESVELFLGKVVHESLAWLYRNSIEGVSVSRESLLTKFLDEWHGRRKSLTLPLKVVKQGDSLTSRRASGEFMLANYFDRTYQTESRRTLYVEREFNLRLSGKHLFNGIVDRVATDSAGSLHVIDFKTSARGSQGLDGDAELQLDAYGLWALLERKVERVHLTFEFLADGTSSTIVLARPGANAVVRELVTRIEEVQREKIFPPKPSPLCVWCGYRSLCPEGSGGRIPRSIGIRLPGRPCPRCGGRLKSWQGSRGPFLRCEGYPNCRYTRDA